MASNYYLINSPAQSVSGSSIAELFEIKPASTYINNLGITTGGGYDTIKISDSSSLGFDAVITDYSKNTKLDFSGTNYGNSSNPLLFWDYEDGTLMKDNDGKISVKFSGYTDGVSWTDNRTNYTLTKNSSVSGGNVSGTDYSDEIKINHPYNEVYGNKGNDTIIANTDDNTILPGYGNDLIIFHGNNNTIEGSTSAYFISSGNDTLISDGNKNYLFDGMNNNLFIGGGDETTIRGGSGVDSIAVYSYGSSANVTVTGGGNNDNYIFSSGLAGVTGDKVLTANYNSSNNDTLNVTITDLDSLDSIYIRNKGMTAITHDVAAEGIYIKDDTGRINLFLSNQRDWDAVKNTNVTFEDMNGNVGTVTLEKAVNLPVVAIPNGIGVDGYNISVTSGFNGDLWMIDGYEGTNYNNQNIQNIDARQNSNTMIIAANYQANNIKAGAGKTSLWGGNGGSADTLESGGNQTMFWYGKNDGFDVLVNAHDYDTINLYDVNLSDVTSFSVSDGSYSLGFNTGNFLTVYDRNALTPAMQLADGNRYAYNRATGSW